MLKTKTKKTGCRDPESDNPMRDRGSLLVLLSVIVFYHFQRFDQGMIDVQDDRILDGIFVLP